MLDDADVEDGGVAIADLVEDGGVNVRSAGHSLSVSVDDRFDAQRVVSAESLCRLLEGILNQAAVCL